MATLRDIQRRIRSVQSTQKITKAMKLVAASKFRRAQERILAARPYATKMRELLEGLAGHSRDETHPLLARRETGRKRLVIITADKGLCGAFNSNILRESLRFLRGAEEASVTLVVVGKKARDFYRRRQFTVKTEMLGFFDRLAYSHAQELANTAARSSRRSQTRSPTSMARRPKYRSCTCPSPRTTRAHTLTRDRRRSTSTSPAPRPSSTPSCRAT